MEEETMPQPEQWQLHGNVAELYERYVVPYILGPWAPGLVALAALQPGERVLDVACGTGVVARLVAAQVGATGHVTGLDLNAGMLAVARTLPSPPGTSITWVEGSAIAMDLPDASWNVILCQQGFQFFPDQPAALREMHRVLVPGGRVLLSVWQSAGPYDIAVSEALKRHVGAETATRYLAARVVPAAEELERLFVEAEFRAVEIHACSMTPRLPQVEVFVLCHLAATPVAGVVAALSDGERAALARHVSLALQPEFDS